MTFMNPPEERYNAAPCLAEPAAETLGRLAHGIVNSRATARVIALTINVPLDARRWCTPVCAGLRRQAMRRRYPRRRRRPARRRRRPAAARWRSQAGMPASRKDRLERPARPVRRDLEALAAVARAHPHGGRRSVAASIAGALGMLEDEGAVRQRKLRLRRPTARRSAAVRAGCNAIRPRCTPISTPAWRQPNDGIAARAAQLVEHRRQARRRRRRQVPGRAGTSAAGCARDAAPAATSRVAQSVTPSIARPRIQLPPGRRAGARPRPGAPPRAPASHRRLRCDLAQCGQHRLAHGVARVPRSALLSSSIHASPVSLRVGVDIARATPRAADATSASRRGRPCAVPASLQGRAAPRRAATAAAAFRPGRRDDARVQRRRRRPRVRHRRAPHSVRRGPAPRGWSAARGRH